MALGTLTSITILVALLTNLIVLPSLLMSLEGNGNSTDHEIIIPHDFDDSDDIEIDKLKLKYEEPAPDQS